VSNKDWQLLSNKALRQELDELDKERLEARRQLLGEEGLQEAAKELEEAVGNDQVADQQTLSSFEMANTESIIFPRLQPYNRTTDGKPPNFDLNKIPYRVHVDDVDSLYVRAILILDGNGLNEDLVALLLGIWMDSPAKLDGSDEVSSEEEVYERRKNVTISFGIGHYEGLANTIPVQVSQSTFQILLYRFNSSSLAKWLTMKLLFLLLRT